jgi:hypothetical protein
MGLSLVSEGASVYMILYRYIHALFVVDLQQSSCHGVLASSGPSRPHKSWVMPERDGNSSHIDDGNKVPSSKDLGLDFVIN